MKHHPLTMLICLCLLSCSKGPQLGRAEPVRALVVGEPSAESRIIDEIGFLNRMWLSPDGDKAKEYYSDLMDRWEACATEDSLPVLEEFISYVSELRRPKGHGPQAGLPWSIFGTIDGRIQDLWWRLKTQGMTPEQKTELALWGLSGEWPDSPLPWGRSVDWLLEIGLPARPALYQYLDTPLSGFWDILRIGALSRISIGNPIFQPTDLEVAGSLDRPHTLGHFVVLDYLVTWQLDLDAVKTGMIRLLGSNDYHIARFALSQLRYLLQYRDDLIPVVCDIARRERPFTSEIWGQIPDEIWGRDFVFVVAAQLGKDPRTIEVFRAYVEHLRQPEAWLGLSSDALRIQQSALNAAYNVLKEWDKLPED